MSRLEALEQLLAHRRALDAVFAQAESVLGSTPESPLFEAVYKMADAYAAAIAREIGDHEGAVSWYIHDNECGERGLTAGKIDTMRHIRTPADLLGLIDEE
jgi:hypothetical protein